MIDTTTVGKSIAYLRKQKQMTQQGLAAAVNVSHQAVSKWENGVALPDMQTMLTLSRLFGVSMEDLLSGAVLETIAQPEAPAPQPEKKPIELKLDADPLHMGIVQEADDVIARAEEQIDDAEEAARPQPEPAAEPESTVHVDMSFAEIVRMAPYVSGDTLNDMLRGCEEQLEMRELIAIAPFTSKHTLGRLVACCEEMDLDALRRLAPFLGRDSLSELILANVDVLDMDALRRIAPFLSRDALAEILAKMPPEDDIAGLKRLASFLSRDALAAQLLRRVEYLTIDDLLAFAPFLKKDALGDLVQRIGQPIDRQQMIRLAKFLPRDQMDRLVYRAMGMKPPKGRADEWNMSVDLGRAYHEIRDAVQTGMHEAREAMKMVGLDGVVDGVSGAMKDVGGRINEAFSTAWNQAAKPQNPAHERAQRIRTRIAEKALNEGNWAWITAHIAELEGDLLKQVLMKCAAAGHGELISENLDRVNLNSAECCRLAQTVKDEDIWEALLGRMETEHRSRVIDYIARVQPESLARFDGASSDPLETALQALKNGEDVSEMLDELSAEAQLQVVKAALTLEETDIEAMFEHIDAVIAPQLTEALLAANRTDLIGALCEQADESGVPAIALTIAQHGAWNILPEALDGLADVDLSQVWPLAVEHQQWDVMDEIALHGDEATLRGVAAALADLGRFDIMDSFIEELDDDTLEQLLDKAMERSDWTAIDRISEILNA